MEVAFFFFLYRTKPAVIKTAIKRRTTPATIRPIPSDDNEGFVFSSSFTDFVVVVVPVFAVSVVTDWVLSVLVEVDIDGPLVVVLVVVGMFEYDVVVDTVVVTVVIIHPVLMYDITNPWYWSLKSVVRVTTAELPVVVKSDEESQSLKGHSSIDGFPS